MQSKRLKFHLFNRAVALAIGFLVIQQLIVASSTIWITRLIAHIQEGSFSFFFLGFYLASLFLPYFPGAAALIEMAKAKVRANVQFVNHFADVYRGQIIEWTNLSHHSTKSSILTGEAPQTINSYLDYIYHFFSCGLNVAFNLLALAFIIEPLLLIAFAIGTTGSFLILKLQKRWKKILALRAQQGRIKWLSMLLNAWDNILLNNIYNFNLWHKRTSQRAHRLTASALRLESFSQSISIGMAFVLLGPTFALICYLAVIHVHDLTWLAIMVVALPRLFQVLSYSYELLFVLSDFPMQKGRLNTVVQLLDLPKPSNACQDLEERIKWDKIQITSKGPPLSPRQLLESLPSTGRYTLQGDNGSGKTSLLLLLKMLKGESAFYLPAKHDLIFQLSKKSLSTGQLTRKTLHELLEHLESPLVLLDEWDANLDKENAEGFSSLIGQLSIERCVIESRHKR